MDNRKPTLYLIPCNHFDLAWRRTFRVDMKNNGRTFIPYAKIEQYYIEDNIKLCEKYPEYKFCIESFSVLDEYLRRFPKMKEKIVSLAKQGKIFVLGSGYAIIDANMVSGETLVRNFLYGTLEAEELLGQKNRQGFRADAFGNSAQLPQILRGCEMEHAFQLSYALPDGKYWRGIDESTVFIDYFKNVGNGGNAAKYPPCPACKGTGKIKGKICESCHGRGIDVTVDEKRYWPFQVNEEELNENGTGYILLAPEEFLPKEATLLRAREFAKKYDIKFVTPEEPLTEFEDALKRIDDKDLTEINSSAELNTAQTGCYVTRIKSKQVLHRQEYSMLSLEVLSSMVWLKGNNYPFKSIKNIWHELFFTAFHDCVTGTVVDPAYKELEVSRSKIDKQIASLTDKAIVKLAAEKDGTVTLLNVNGFSYKGTAKVKISKGIKNATFTCVNGNCKCEVIDISTTEDGNYATVFVDSISPFTAVSFKITASENCVSLPMSKDREIENSRFRITADENGICEIFDKKLNKIILGLGKYRPSEFILEHDEGDPWRTLSHDRDRIPLSKNTRLISVEKGEHIQRMRFSVSTPGFPEFHYIEGALEATYSVTLIEGSDRIDFHTDVYWNNFNHRLRIAFPSTFSGAGIYGIPYGMIERKEYEPQYIRVPGINGDYPAQNWGGIQGDEASFAVLNRGTPCYNTEFDAEQDRTDLFITVLRSPGVPSELHEPNNYTMTDWDGMRDVGNHSFDYSLCVYDNGFGDNSVVSDSVNYCSAPIAVCGELDLPDLPKVDSKNAAVMSVKASEDGKALVLRINEYHGKEGNVNIELPAWVNYVEKVNMLERKGEKLEVSDNSVSYNVHPYEITTLKFHR